MKSNIGFWCEGKTGEAKEKSREPASAIHFSHFFNLFLVSFCCPVDEWSTDHRYPGWSQRGNERRNGKRKYLHFWNDSGRSERAQGKRVSLGVRRTG